MTPGAQRAAVKPELLDPMVAELADIQAVVRADRQVKRIAHPARFRTTAAPHSQQLSLGVENLDPVVAAIGDVELILLVDGQGPGPQKLAWLVTMAAPLAEPFSLRREDLDPVVLAVFGHIEIVGTVDHHVGRIAESARGRPLHAVANLELQLALFRVNQHAVEMRVGDQQPAMAIDGQAAGSIDVEGRRPPAAEVIAIAIEDLDPVCQVGNVKLVMVIKRGDSRLVQPSGMGAVDAPDQVGQRSLLEITTRLAEYYRNQPSQAKAKCATVASNVPKRKHPACPRNQESLEIGRKGIGP